jgi:DNA mismatch repair protein MSH2
MDDAFCEFYKALDRDKFKFFTRNEAHSVYNEDIERMPRHNPRDVTERRGVRELRPTPSEMEEAIRHMLADARIGVQEYEDFRLVREGFPGNWKDFTDLLLDQRMVPAVASVRLTDKTELSFLATAEAEIFRCTFEDDDMNSSLYVVLNELNVIEVVYDNKRLGPFFSNMGVVSHLCSRRSGDSTRMLCEYLRVDMEQYRVSEYVRPFVCQVDSSALASLNITSEKEHCVLRTFPCHTNQGWRLLNKFVRQPLRSREEIERRLDFVDCFRELELDVLRNFPDLLRLTRRIESSKINLQEMLRLVQVLDQIPCMLHVLDSGQSTMLREDFIRPLQDLHATFEPLKTELKRVIDTEAAEHNIYRLRTDISGQLQELGTSLEKITRDMEAEHSRVCGIYAKTKYDRASGVFKVTRTEYQSLKEMFKKNGFLELSFLKGGVTFTTRNLAFLNGAKERINGEVEKEERAIRERIRAMLREYVSPLEVLNYLVALMDVFNAFSMKSRMRGYSRPVFSEGEVEVRGAFHPLLEDRDYIPNSITLGEKRACVVTGPNMGGKSTFLKACGVIAVLGQMGSYVPAEYSRMPIFDGIHIRIGASDCTITGSSTFMGEMRDIAGICKFSSAGSLVIVDELGRGTSAVDGLSIALAVKEHLVATGAVTLFATHFPELCGEDVVNKRVRSDGTLLMYELVDGSCDVSFGISVAEKVNFPEEVVLMSKRLMEERDEA